MTAMKAQVLPLFAAICVLFFSCGSDEKISREVFEEVQQANEVKKLSEVDIFNEAFKWGEEISAEAQKQLMATLAKAIEEKGASGAAEFCNTQALSILKEVGDRHGVTIRRVSNNSTNPANQPLEEEKMLLDAYEYNEQNGIKHEPNLQKIKDGSILLFTKAIIYPDGLCLNDEAVPDQDIDEDTLQNKPFDKAQDGLNGMWSVAIPQKEVVKRL
jgi:hypothetical protein